MKPFAAIAKWSRSVFATRAQSSSTGDQWSRLLDERFSAARTIAGSWALWQKPGHEWGAFPIEPLQPWLTATAELAPPHVGQRVRIVAWEGGIPLATFLEHARFSDDALGDDVIAALKSARTLGTGEDIRIGLDGRVLRARGSASGGEQPSLVDVIATRVIDSAPPTALRDLVRALFADEARKDDEAREDLAALTRDVIDAHWATYKLVAVDPSAPRLNLRTPRSIKR